MISNLIAWLLALIAMTVCELEIEDACPAPPPAAASTSGNGGNSGATVTNPKIINEI